MIKQNVQQQRRNSMARLLAALSLAAFVSVGPAYAKKPEQPKARRETISNLNKALQSEANASNRYRLFAQKAQEEGHPEISSLFRAAAQSEAIHRENHRQAILTLGGTPEPIELKSVDVKSTRENLDSQVRGEAAERERTYPKYIEQARKDQAPEAVRTFTFARNSEAEHEVLFKGALQGFGKTAAAPSDYYVSRRTGDTLAVPRGEKPERSDLTDFVRVT